MAVFESQRDGEAAAAREARIAELRARRRKRLRWLAVRSGIGLPRGFLRWMRLTRLRALSHSSLTFER